MAKEIKSENTPKKSKEERLADARVKAQAARKRKAERKKRARAMARKSQPEVERSVTRDLIAKQAVPDNCVFSKKATATCLKIALDMQTPKGMKFTLSMNAIDKIRHMGQNVVQDLCEVAMDFTDSGKRQGTRATDFEKAKKALRFEQTWPIISNVMLPTEN